MYMETHPSKLRNVLAIVVPVAAINRIPDMSSPTAMSVVRSAYLPRYSL